MKKLCLAVLCLLCLTDSLYAQDLILTGTLTSGWHYINGQIETQDTTIINSGVNFDLIAQTKIIFNPGFQVMPGGTLNAAVSLDTDGDLVLDLVEQRSGCMNYLKTDTDDDGLLDSEEDSNKNGIQEPGLNETSACNADTDGDKIDDKWEKDNGLNPLQASDSEDDPDGDKLNNYMEYYFNSHPHDAGSVPPKGSYYEYDELGRIKKIIRIK